MWSASTTKSVLFTGKILGPFQKCFKSVADCNTFETRPLSNIGTT